MQFRILFLKALGAGERWITVKPHGADEKGVPVLIKEQPDGSAKVIGGAGGKLNHLRLRGVRSESDYKREAGERRKTKQAAEKEQTKRDKALGIHESKTKAREALRGQVHEHERKFIESVGNALGWKTEETQFDAGQHAGLSDAALAKAALQHHHALLRRAHEAVDAQRQRLVIDAEARADAGLEAAPIHSDDPEKLSVDDLDGTKPTGAGLGFAAHYGERAEAAGLTEDELKLEAGKVKEAKQAGLTPAQRSAAVRRGETAQMVKDELKSLRDPVLPEAKKALADAKQAVELLKAQKRLKAATKQAADKVHEIKSATTEIEPKAFVIEYTADPDLEKKIGEDIENDLRTARTRAFLTEAAKVGGGDAALARHIGAGAYNSVNALALAVGGDALIDRSVVDVLGIAGAAQVLARRIQNDLPAEAEKIADGMQEFHLHHYMETSEAALADAKELLETAKEIELGEAASGQDLAAAQALNQRRRDAVAEAQKVLGTAAGEMEANAALTVALKQGKKDTLQVPLGHLTPEAAITQVRAIGLQRGDYVIETVGPNTFLTVNGAGMDRMAKPVNRADIAQVRRNLDIIEGRQDEDGWMPKGVANRPDLVAHAPAGAAPRLAEPFQPGGDLEATLRDYIGARAADGDPPADIIADIQSADFFQKVGWERSDAYRQALDKVAPLKGEDGKMRRAEALAPEFDKYADGFVEKRYGGARATINRQHIREDQKSLDALHRALAVTPEGTAAFKPIADMSAQDQGALREFFYQHVAKEKPEAAGMRADLERMDAEKPEATALDMFGENAPNPEYREWQNRRNELSTKINASSLAWGKYVEAMRGQENAYASMQDLVRSRVTHGFAEAYNIMNVDAPIKVGRTVIRNNLDHLDTVDPVAREARMAKERALIDSMRERQQGRYASGGVTEKLGAAREREAAMDQAQMGFFSAEDSPPKAVEPAADERNTLGHEAERQIADMMAVVGKNFKPGQPFRMWQPSVSGKDVARQRAIKLIEANKRVGLSFGVGSGKTFIGLGAFAHLHETGQAKRGLYLVPSIVQGQFGGEALRYLEPGKFNWHIEPGESREQRIAAYKNPAHDFAVMTHAAFRDDMLHLAAAHEGIPEAEVRAKLEAMSTGERKTWMADLMKREGINFDYLMADEGHDFLDRAGKEDSGMSMVGTALAHNTPYYVSASADPVKNDVSEIFSAFQKMDPERYSDRDTFMRRYGPDTAGAKEALRREMARYFYPSKIDSGVKTSKSEVKVPLSGGQHAALADLDRQFAAARIARMEGKVDVAAMKAISPSSFARAPEAEHEAIAKNLQANMGILKGTAIRHVLYDHPEAGNLQEVVRTAHERKGKPGVVFAHSRAAVENISRALTREGHRVVTITGSDSAKEKERKRLMFRPEQGDASADILVASDAAAVGMNAQRGQWLFQYDTPQTAKTHAQRRGRVDRIGQKNEVELIDAIADHPEEQRARKRLADKYGLRDLMTSPLEGLDDTGLAYFLKQRKIQQVQGAEI